MIAVLTYLTSIVLIVRSSITKTSKTDHRSLTQYLDQGVSYTAPYK